jgi:SH3 domain-containing YSC84-like protein 1
MARSSPGARFLPGRIAWAIGLLIAAAPLVAQAQTDQQALVDRATLTVQDLIAKANGPDVISMLRRARAVMICPRLFKAGFILGGQGGDCVLLARAGQGSWSDPAFYSSGSGSIGFQVGIQDSELMMVIMTQHGLDALMDTQFKFGADASLAVATFGGGIEGATAPAMNADIVAFSNARGLFAGVSLSGTGMTTDTDANQAYYGQPLAARQIVVQMAANNPGADPLRAILSRYGAQVTPPPPPAMPPPMPYSGVPIPPPPPGGPAMQYSQSAPSGPVQSVPLPPPR